MSGIEADKKESRILNGRNVFLFWGALDALAILAYVVVSLLAHRIPLYTELSSFLGMAQHDALGTAFFLVSMALICSIAVSAFLFLGFRRHARTLAYWQIPFRLLLMKPSLMFIPWLLPMAGQVPAIILAALLMLSEGLKFLTLHMTRHFPATASK